MKTFFGYAGAAVSTMAIVGLHLPSRRELTFVRCTQGDFHLPGISIHAGQILASLHADSCVHVDAPTKELVRAVHRLTYQKLRQMGSERDARSSAGGCALNQPAIPPKLPGGRNTAIDKSNCASVNPEYRALVEFRSVQAKLRARKLSPLDQIATALALFPARMLAKSRSVGMR